MASISSSTNQNFNEHPQPVVAINGIFVRPVMITSFFNLASTIIENDELHIEPEAVEGLLNATRTIQALDAAETDVLLENIHALFNNSRNNQE